MSLRLVRQAQAWLVRGAPRRAASLYAQVLAARPDDRGAWLWSGAALAECGRFEQARRHAEHGAALAPEVPAGRVLLARVLHDAGDLEAACEQLAPCADANRQAAALLTACLIRLGDQDRAVAAFPPELPHAPWVLARLLAAIEERTPLPPEQPAPLPGENGRRGSVRRGLLLLRAERWQPALAAFRAARPSPVAAYGQAVALYYLQHLDAAEQLLLPVVPRLDPPFAADALSILGKVDLERGRNPSGVLRLRQAVVHGAGTPENYYALGVGLLRQGARLPAVKAFQRCVSAEFVRRRFGDWRA